MDWLLVLVFLFVLVLVLVLMLVLVLVLALAVALAILHPYQPQCIYTGQWAVLRILVNTGVTNEEGRLSVAYPFAPDQYHFLLLLALVRSL